MELLEYKNKLFELLKIEDISQLPKALEKITDNQKLLNELQKLSGGRKNGIKKEKTRFKSI